MVEVVTDGVSLDALIDRIVMVLTVSAIDYTFLSSSLYRLHRDGMISSPRTRMLRYLEVTRARMVLYRNRGVVVTVYRTFGPNATTGVKFDWSPGIVTAATHHRFAALLHELVQGGVEELLARGTVRYLEYAVDVPGLRCRDILMTYPRVSRSHLYFNIRDGSQTIYIGTRKSRKSFAAYDKAPQLRVRHARWIRGDRLRIEYRDRESHDLGALRVLPNPFAALVVADVASARALDQTQDWQRFLDRCEDDGAQKALQRCSGHRRREFLRRLASAHAAWFDANAIWQAWPTVLDRFEAETRGQFSHG